MYLNMRDGHVDKVSEKLRFSSDDWFGSEFATVVGFRALAVLDIEMTTLPLESTRSFRQTAKTVLSPT